MKLPRPIVLVALFAMLAPLAAPVAVRSADPAPSDALESWLPDSLAGYVKIHGLGERIDGFLRSDLRREIESMDVVKALMAAEGWRAFQNGLDEFKTATGKEGLDVFKDLFGREVVIGFRGKADEKEAVLITRAAGEKELEVGLEAVRKAIQAKAGFPIEGYKTSYGDRSVETVGEVSFTSMGSVFVLSSRRPLLESVIDAAAGKKTVDPASRISARAASILGKDDLVSAVVRPGELPNFNIPGKLDNPVGSLIAGGLLGAFEGSDLIAGSLRLGGGRIELEVASLLKGALNEKYKAFFPESAADGGASRLRKGGVVALWSFHRDLKAWWERREDLLVSKAVGELLQFNQVMSIFFGGRSFQDEVLPRLGSTITLVAKNLERKDGEKPQPSLPSFAILFEIKDAKEFQTNLAAAFQTLIGVINADSAQKHPDQGMMFLLKSEKVGEVEVQTAATNLSPEARKGIAGNFSPSLAVVGSQVVISSTVELAKALAAELGSKDGPSRASARANDSLVIEAPSVAAVLKENFDLAVADQMMKKGISKETSESQLKSVLQGLKLVRDLTIETRKEGDAVRTVFRLRGAAAPESAAKEPGKRSEKF